MEVEGGENEEPLDSQLNVVVKTDMESPAVPALITATTSIAKTFAANDPITFRNRNRRAGGMFWQLPAFR